MQAAQHRCDLDYSHDPVVLLVSAFEPVKRCIDFTTTRVHQRDIGRQKRRGIKALFRFKAPPENPRVGGSIPPLATTKSRI
jgi:hypothetical protein